jgi:hypothetical protein
MAVGAAIGAATSQNRYYEDYGYGGYGNGGYGYAPYGYGNGYGYGW